MFPRSASDDPHRHGTFDDVIAHLPRIRDMGFDVLYFPPIHPIGTTARKGRNNSLKAGPDDVGSPYAIGSPDGGHTAVHPQLGTLESFRALVDAARGHGSRSRSISRSSARPTIRGSPRIQAGSRGGPTARCASRRIRRSATGTSSTPISTRRTRCPTWLALRDAVLFWVDAGVRIFRVDNPHTKPLPFWAWMIDDVRGRHPDVVFLSEAFTRPAMMYRLAKVGFSQSYTYFTWRESKREFIDYLTELTTGPAREFFRPNFFVNTPDINPRHLQNAPRTQFVIRAALAATLAGSWGLYSGFELGESAPLPDSEEYADAEKYELRARDWSKAAHIGAEVARLNRARRAHPALQTHLGLTFADADNDAVLVFVKATPAYDSVVVVAISTDPWHPQVANFTLDASLWRGLGRRRRTARRARTGRHACGNLARASPVRLARSARAPVCDLAAHAVSRRRAGGARTGRRPALLEARMMKREDSLDDVRRAQFPSLAPAGTRAGAAHVAARRRSARTIRCGTRTRSSTRCT